MFIDLKDCPVDLIFLQRIHFFFSKCSNYSLQIAASVCNKMVLNMKGHVVNYCIHPYNQYTHIIPYVQSYMYALHLVGESD